MIHHGDLFDVLPTLAAESIDACVTDPPYGIGFMNKAWDNFSPAATAARIVPNTQIVSDNPNLKGRTRGPASSPSAVEYNRSLAGQREFQAWCERWAREVFRVLKPGAYLVVCGAPRSFHRMTCGLEDAGFEIRDCLSWLYGQGFPKSLNVGKAIDQAAGVEREVTQCGERKIGLPGQFDTKWSGERERRDKPVTATAHQWDGWGTALKPGWEPCILARKPFKGNLVSNLARHGTGAIHVDACRIDYASEVDKASATPQGACTAKVGALAGGVQHNGARSTFDRPEQIGRWPANVVLDADAAAMLDEQSGECEVSGAAKQGHLTNPGRTNEITSIFGAGNWASPIYNDTGGASRFFYVAKPSRAERDYGCSGLEARSGGEATDRVDGSAGVNSPRAGAGRTGGSRNVHPTVKPVELMRWLVRLITPIDGLVLDPFTGSGTTGMACRYEQRRFVGIEREAQYVQIAERRIAAVAPLFGEIA